jgi:hypothetical protein
VADVGATGLICCLRCRALTQVFFDHDCERLRRGYSDVTPQPEVGYYESSPGPAGPDDVLYLHARCHLSARLVAFVDQDDLLTIACGECERPVLYVGSRDELTQSEVDSLRASRDEERGRRLQ